MVGDRQFNYMWRTGSIFFANFPLPSLKIHIIYKTVVHKGYLHCLILGSLKVVRRGGLHGQNKQKVCYMKLEWNFYLEGSCWEKTASLEKERIFFVLWHETFIVRLALFVTRNNTCNQWNQNLKDTAIIHFSRMVFLFPSNNVFTR